jgi:hypothetical protein
MPDAGGSFFKPHLLAVAMKPYHIADSFGLGSDHN